MNNDNLIAFQPPEASASLSDALSELVRQGARQVIAQAVKAELTEFLAQYQSQDLESYDERIRRAGHLSLA